MAIVVTENWSGRRLSYEDPWTGYREFVVTGATSDAAALIAVDSADPTKLIPQQDAEHDTAPLLLCQGPAIKEVKGPDYRVVGCSYKLTSSGGGDLLNKDADIECVPVTIMEPCDVDLDNRPLLFSTADPISGGTREVSAMKISIVKPFPHYDADLVKTFHNAVNLHQVTMLGQFVFDPEHLKCLFVGPNHSFTVKTKVFYMRFDFFGFLDDTLGKYPFQHRFLDAAENGYYLEGGKRRKARFSNGNSELINTAIRLDGRGAPLTGIDPDIKVGQDNNAPVSPVPGVEVYKREFYDRTGNFQGNDTANAETGSAFLYFKKVRVVDFTPLNSLLSRSQT